MDLKWSEFKTDLNRIKNNIIILKHNQTIVIIL